jgi:predicted kinase
MGNKWIGVDLDGTLAFYDGWKGSSHIGKPIPRMRNRVLKKLAEGYEIRIFTARASDLSAIPVIQRWLQTHGFPQFKITNVKDFQCVEIWDDRVVQILPNKGVTISEGDWKMQRVYMTVGVVGSGKSTWAKCKLASLHASGVEAVIINRDAMRTMLSGEYKYDAALEPHIKELTHQQIIHFLNHGYDVIVDETHVNKAKRSDLIDLVRNNFDRSMVAIDAIVFPNGPECMERRIRDSRGISPEKWREVYLEMMKSYESVHQAEGFDSITMITGEPSNYPVEKPPVALND